MSKGKWFALALCVLLVGCDFHKMTRAEVIAAVKECQAGGMSYTLMRNGWDYSTMDVACDRPQESGHE